jgi:hypothetical protein
MIDVDEPEKIFSVEDEDELFDSAVFDPETTFIDDDVDSDTLAFRDAVRDICNTEGRFELILP